MIRYIIAPLVGGIIGYITNDLAIRMLFRPRQAIYIGRFHVPFTPGVIPSQKARIAVSIGEVISGQLLNEETLRQTMLSESAIDKLKGKVRELVNGLGEEQRTFHELLQLRYDSEVIRVKGEELEKMLTDTICAKLVEAKLGQVAADSVAGSWMDALFQHKHLSRLVDDGAQEALRKTVTNKVNDILADKINDMIAEKAPGAVYNMLDGYRQDLLDMRVCDLYDRYKDKEDALVARVTEMYRSILGNNLEKLLKAVNIEQIVQDKINGLDPAELERLIFGVMKHELRAIVYLGALLGFMMGFVNLLLQ